jgi:hypothetical protein
MTHWLKCKIDKGMFSDEVCITYAGYSCFIGKQDVKGEIGQDGLVRVSLMGMINSNFELLAILPDGHSVLFDKSSIIEEE